MSKAPLARPAWLMLVCLATLAIACQKASNRSPLLQIAGAARSSTGSGSTGGGSSGGTPLDIATLDRGSNSATAYPRATDHLVVNDADWAALWARHSVNALPPVNFAGESVVAAFLGTTSGSAHSTEVVQVSSGADIHALLREFRLASWKPNTAQITYPYHIVRCNLPAAGRTLSVTRQALLDFEALQAGNDSAIGAGDPTYRGELRVLRSDTELRTFYARHAPGASPPPVDFSREMVVCVLAGYHATWGHQVRTRRILFDPRASELRVVYAVDPYRGGAPPPNQFPETPYQILRVTPSAGAIRAERLGTLALTPLQATAYSLYVGSLDIQVIRNDADYQAVWTSRIGGGAPPIDFRTEQVVAAFFGQKTSGGYTIAVAAAASDEDGVLDIRIETTVPTGAATTVMTSPAHVVKLPRTYGAHTLEMMNVTPVP